jgi:(E)-4-hydroxy-3-methylbut-2-enyl-diphosphate synthase
MAEAVFKTISEQWAIPRRKTRQVMVGKVPVGGGAPVSVQSMTKTVTHDVRATLRQIEEIARAGADIVRCAAPEMSDAEALVEIVRESPLPVVADIHYDYRLALKALEGGVACLRLNPGNIGMPTGDNVELKGDDKVRIVVREAKARKIPIRIGVNAGSLEPELLMKYGHPTPEAMVESALHHVHILEDLDFQDIKISLKATDVPRTVAAYRLLAGKVDYPFHLGITEAGTLGAGTVKSSVGLGILLAEGLGDTIRVSLTGECADEARVGNDILESLGLRNQKPNVVSCPTCGRLQVPNMIEIAQEIEKRIAHVRVPLNLAVMGCEVNGPGESKAADLGVSLGEGWGYFFKHGEKLRRVKAEDVVEEFVKEVEILVREEEGKRKTA